MIRPLHAFLALAATAAMFFTWGYSVQPDWQPYPAKTALVKQVVNACKPIPDVKKHYSWKIIPSKPAADPLTIKISELGLK